MSSFYYFMLLVFVCILKLELWSDGKPAIRMHIIRIAEEFNKLKLENEFKILKNFSIDDLRGLSAVRNFIAHDYDSIDNEIIENVVRYNIPTLKKSVLEVMSSLEID